MGQGVSDLIFQLDKGLDKDVSKALELIQRRVRDAQKDRSIWEDRADINRKLYLGVQGPFTGHKKHSKRSDRHFDVNRIRQVCEISAAVETEVPPRIRFIPREAGEEPEIFLKREAAQALPEDVGLSPDQLAGNSTISKEVAALLTQPRPTGQTDESTGVEILGPPLLTEDQLIFMDDRLVADALSQEFDSEWEAARGSGLLRHNILDRAVIGWRDTLIQWDSERHIGELVDINTYNGWIDRWSRDTTNAEYYVLRQILPVLDAIKEYPDQEQLIRDSARTGAGNLIVEGSRSSSGLSSEKSDHNQDRNVVVLWTMWTRDVRFPLTLEDALEADLVEPRSEFEETVVTDDLTGEESVVANRVDATTEDGSPIFTLVSTGEETSEGRKNWPVRFGIHQLQVLGNSIIFDGESDFVDIPVARNKYILVPDSPHGKGAPHDLERLQELYNRLWSIFHDHFRFFRSPQQTIPRSVYDELTEGIQEIHASADQTYVLPDHLYAMFGKDIVSTIPVPQLGDAIFRLIQMVGNELDNLGGLTDVLRGEAKSEWSAKLFERATSAARGPIGFRARNTSDYLRHIAKVWANLIIDFLPTDEWARRNKKYPPQILEAMRARLKRLDFDVSVEIGGQGTQERERADMLALWNAGLNTSTTFAEMLLERFGIAKPQQIAAELAQAQAAAAAPPVAGQQPPAA